MYLYFEKVKHYQNLMIFTLEYLVRFIVPSDIPYNSDDPRKLIHNQLFHKMTNYCRVCGKPIHRITFLKKQKLLKDIIVWQYWILAFDPSKIHICQDCPKYLYKQHTEDFRRRKDGRLPKYRISIVKWDSNADCPFYDQDGQLMRYEIARNRRLNGSLRNINEQLADGELRYPDVNPTQLTEDTNEQLTHGELRELRHPDVNSIQLTVDIKELLNHEDIQYHTMNSIQTTSNDYEESTQLLEGIGLSNRPIRTGMDTSVNKERFLHYNIKENNQCGLRVIDCGEELGLGIQTTQYFMKNDYVATYVGELLNKFDADLKEKEYASSGEDDKCFTHYFRWNEKVWCYDATIDDGTFGRLINHSKRYPNIQAKVAVIGGVPFIYFKAIKDIPSGTELRYDYGDRKADLPWLKQ